MTQKALTFVVSGMLAAKRELGEKRIARILSMIQPDALDCFTDGFVLDAKVIDEQALFEYIKNRNCGKILGRIDSWKLTMDEPFMPQLRVTCSRTAWFKPDSNKSWDLKDSKSDEYCECRTIDYVEVISLYAACNIPGVQMEIL